MLTVTNPISSNQVIDLNVDFKCIDAPTCVNLNSGVQAIVDHICEEIPDDWSTLDFRCVTPANNLFDVVQNVINELPCDSVPVSPVNVLGTEVTGLSYCASDGWDCSETDACLAPANPCDPGNITLEVLLQALISRNVAQGNAIKALCDRVSALEAANASLTLTITNIQTSCCP